LPSRFVITAFRQTFLSGILKAYIDSGGTKVENLNGQTSGSVFNRKGGPPADLN
jgi:hypothetical protein